MKFMWGVPIGKSKVRHKKSKRHVYPIIIKNLLIDQLIGIKQLIITNRTVKSTRKGLASRTRRTQWSIEEERVSSSMKLVNEPKLTMSPAETTEIPGRRVAPEVFTQTMATGITAGSGEDLGESNKCHVTRSRAWKKMVRGSGPDLSPRTLIIHGAYE